MDKTEAQERFAKASALYDEGRYGDALAELNELDLQYPDNPRVLEAKARTLEHLGQHEDALEIFDRLVDDLGYEKSRARRDRLADMLGVERDIVHLIERETSEEVGADEVDVVEISEVKKPQFRIKPIRLLLLVAILAGMYFGYIPYWLGAILIVGYFAVKLAIRAAMFRLFTMPFRAKGKALAGATTLVHGFEWTDAPPAIERDDDEEDGRPKEPLRYVWIDVTITPPVRTQGFTQWEPGELVLAPASLRYRGPDDLDRCYAIHQVRYRVHEGEEVDEGYKVQGPQRIKVLAGVPLNEDNFRFAYYFETFGEISLKG